MSELLYINCDTLFNQRYKKVSCYKYTSCISFFVAADGETGPFLTLNSTITNCSLPLLPYLCKIIFTTTMTINYTDKRVAYLSRNHDMFYYLACSFHSLCCLMERKFPCWISVMNCNWIWNCLLTVLGISGLKCWAANSMEHCQMAQKCRLAWLYTGGKVCLYF